MPLFTTEITVRPIDQPNELTIKADGITITTFTYDRGEISAPALLLPVSLDIPQYVEIITTLDGWLRALTAQHAPLYAPPDRYQATYSQDVDTAQKKKKSFSGVWKLDGVTYASVNWAGGAGGNPNTTVTVAARPAIRWPWTTYRPWLDFHLRCASILGGL